MQVIRNLGMIFLRDPRRNVIGGGSGLDRPPSVD
jgi:hypothetical protein